MALDFVDAFAHVPFVRVLVRKKRIVIQKAMDGTVDLSWQQTHIAQRNIVQPGQVVTYLELEQLVYEFEEVLGRFGIPIQSGSELEKACCAVLDVMGRSQRLILVIHRKISVMSSEKFWVFGCFSGKSFG